MLVDALHYPGLHDLRRAERAVANPDACLDALGAAFTRGLPLNVRVRALRLWTDACEARLKPQAGEPLLDHAHAARILAAAREAGVVDAVKLADPPTMERACATLDLLAALAIAEMDDDAEACALADSLAAGLSITPTLTLQSRANRDAASGRPACVPAAADGAPTERRAVLMAANARRGLLLLDGLLTSVAVEAALAGRAIPERVRLDASVLARLCLDQHPVFQEEMATVQRLVDDGLPTDEAAALLVRLADGLSGDKPWQALRATCPTLFRSRAWLLRRMARDFAAGRAEAVGWLLEEALAAGVLDDADALRVWTDVADALTDERDLANLALLGEALQDHLDGDLRDMVVRRTAEALVCLADDADTDDREPLLLRALAVHPQSEIIARRLELDAVARRDRRWRQAAAFACGLAIAVAAAVALALPV